MASLDAFVQYKGAKPYRVKFVVGGGANAAVTPYRATSPMSHISSENFASAPMFAGSRPILANLGLDVDRRFAQFYAQDLDGPTLQRNSISMPTESLLWGVIAPLTGSAIDQLTSQTFSGPVGAGTAVYQQAVMPLEIDVIIAKMRLATHPTVFGDRVIHGAGSWGIYDTELPAGGAIPAACVFNDPAKMRDDPAVLTLFQRLAGQFAQNYDEEEPGDPQSIPYPGDESRRAFWYRQYTTTIPAPESETFDMMITTSSTTGRYLLLLKSEVEAYDKAAVEAMQTAEKSWVTYLQKWTRDGVPATATIESVFTRPPATMDNRMSETQREFCDRWFTTWRSAAATAADPSKQQARKDALWEQFKKLYPGSTVTREQFEANPSAYLTDNSWLPATSADVNKSWFDRIMDGLGWLGKETVDLLKSTDSSTLATLFGATAAAGWWGSGLQTAAIVVGLILLLK